jgi:hypothetical protein
VEDHEPELHQSWLPTAGGPNPYIPEIVGGELLIGIASAVAGAAMESTHATNSARR